MTPGTLELVGRLRAHVDDAGARLELDVAPAVAGALAELDGEALERLRSWLEADVDLAADLAAGRGPAR